MRSIEKKRRSLAITIIEFSVVLLISGLVFATITPAVMKMMDSAKTSTTEEEIAEMVAEIDDFIEANGHLPDSLEEVFGEVPLDPWGNPYQYLNFDNVQGNAQKRKDKNLVPINTDYDFYSMGPDGESASPLTASISKDDIIRARNGAYIGTAEDY